MAEIGVALVGAGSAALPHLRALAMLRGRAALRGVCARSPERVAPLAARAGVAPPPLFADLAAVCADPAVAVAIVATPPDARLEIVGPLADAGKAVLLEKPVARDAAEAEAVAARCATAGAPLGVVFQHRFRAGAQAMARLVRNGRLGALAAVEVRVPWWREQSYYDAPGRGSRARDGGGVLISQAVHSLDLMLSLAGPVASVRASTATTALHAMECEDFVAAGLRFASGAVGALTASTAFRPGAAESVALHGALGSATLTGGEMVATFADGAETRVGEAAATGGGADPMAFPADWHRDLIAAFLDALEAGRPPSPGAAAGLAAQRLIDALVEAGRTGGDVAVAP